MEKTGKRIDWFIKLNPDIDDFKKEIWKDIPGNKKVECAWEMVVEAMALKKTPEKLKFQKVLRLPNKPQSPKL